MEVPIEGSIVLRPVLANSGSGSKSCLRSGFILDIALPFVALHYHQRLPKSCQRETNVLVEYRGARVCAGKQATHRASTSRGQNMVAPRRRLCHDPWSPERQSVSDTKTWSGVKVPLNCATSSGSGGNGRICSIWCSSPEPGVRTSSAIVALCLCKRRCLLPLMSQA